MLVLNAQLFAEQLLNSPAVRILGDANPTFNMFGARSLWRGLFAFQQGALMLSTSRCCTDETLCASAIGCLVSDEHDL
jgi:hypothetical protein